MLEKNLSRNGVATHYGTAQFTDRNTLQVGDETFVGKNIVIATGAKPMPLGIAGEELLATSTDFLEMETLPERIVFIGGGYIAFEFAHIAARAGAQVTMLEMMPRSLPAFDPDLADLLIEATKEVGIDIQFETRVSEVVKEANGAFIVKAASPNGSQSFTADLVVHGAGRVPAAIC
jgi:glutathione reductase (NADPH)